MLGESSHLALNGQTSMRRTGYLRGDVPAKPTAPQSAGDLPKLDPSQDKPCLGGFRVSVIGFRELHV